MKPQRHLLLFGSLLCAITAVKAQSIGPSLLNAAGSSTTVAGIIHEYSIGQPMAGNTYIGGSLVITPFALQPAATTGISNPEISATELKVFPSPMESGLYLQPAFKGSGTLHYSLYDVAGKLILEEEMSLISGSEQQTVSVAQLAAGQYTLQVLWTQSGITYTNGYKLQKLQ